MQRPVRAVLVALVPLAILGACGGPARPTGSPATSESPEPPLAAATQRNEGGQVTVVATWTGPAEAALDVQLDTHSVDLDALDLADAVLRNDRGERLMARPWAAPKGGHHREGVLAFTGDAAGFFAGAKWMELTLTGVGDLPERTLRWEIGP